MDSIPQKNDERHGEQNWVWTVQRRFSKNLALAGLQINKKWLLSITDVSQRYCGYCSKSPGRIWVLSANESTNLLDDLLVMGLVPKC